VSKDKSARKKAARRAKLKRRYLRTSGVMRKIVRRKQKARLKHRR